MVPKLIFIVPYRDRKEHRQFFTKYMEFIMEDYKKEDYEIYFSHQCDNRPFNRGATKNIGFLAMKNKYPHDYQNITFVFNDVDTLPYTKNLLPYETEIGIVKHFYGFKFALGGIFSIKGIDFEKTNGFPNFWGWSMEDNIMNKRVLEAKLTINRDVFFTVKSRSVLQFVDGFAKTISKQEVADYISNRYIEGFKDIKNIKYTIKDLDINITSFNTEREATNLRYETHDITKPNASKIRLSHKEKQMYTPDIQKSPLVNFNSIFSRKR